MTEKITTFTKVSELYQRNDSQIIDAYNNKVRWGNYPSIEMELSLTQERLTNTMNALLVTLKLLKERDANQTTNSEAGSPV